ncbi:pyridoxamine 5'-phosphate oxidase family protein [Erwinia billingiae]|uniref:pyridoxamine 5'-phosphate oxidase family protein n=1 Tax=Erwinia billingiae TaxID=182337 RepID=UPI000CFE88BB|nr:pyridoxamine 5'-phosphate oxidase family protein [Erwinia billingiae]PRB62474.1 pyridoxamine 5'-phosphate oxidase [Erwinia billingiae]
MFHPGERLAQQKAGYGEVRAAVYPAMPDQHRQFYAGLTAFYLSALDEKGFPVAMRVQGAAGFLHSNDGSRLDISLAAIANAPLLPTLKPGMPVGGLGIDFSNRRRNRVNGVVETVNDRQVTIRVLESFGNCPKYIQRRDIPSGSAGRMQRVEVEPLQALDADARYLIAATDTFFVASYARRENGVGGVDISHRGGLPGFITVQQGKLRIPDYSGNRYMNTLGNLLVEPRCALLLMDFHQGAALHIQGRAEIEWQSPAQGLTERHWQVDIENVTRLRQLFPAAGLRVEFADSSLAAG